MIGLIFFKKLAIFRTASTTKVIHESTRCGNLQQQRSDCRGSRRLGNSGPDCLGELSLAGSSKHVFSKRCSTKLIWDGGSNSSFFPDHSSKTVMIPIPIDLHLAPAWWRSRSLAETRQHQAEAVLRGDP